MTDIEVKNYHVSKVILLINKGGSVSVKLIQIYEELNMYRRLKRKGVLKNTVIL